MIALGNSRHAGGRFHVRTTVEQAGASCQSFDGSDPGLGSVFFQRPERGGTSDVSGRPQCSARLFARRRSSRSPPGGARRPYPPPGNALSHRSPDKKSPMLSIVVPARRGAVDRSQRAQPRRARVLRRGGGHRRRRALDRRHARNRRRTRTSIRRYA